MVLGRTYGDACLNEGGTLLDVRPLDRLLTLDEARATLECEAGASLGEILSLVVPRGFFLPVVPGTQHVTVGGAIANDVHGKNHHRAGTFGAQVEALELVRSTGERRVCTANEDGPLFRATVGGLGLTGLVVRARLRLRSVPSPWIVQEAIPLSSLEAFFDHAAAADRDHEFTVAWIDCLALGASLGRGVLFQGDHAAAPPAGAAPTLRPPKLGVPFPLPFSPLNRVTIRAFNALYEAAQRRRRGRRTVGFPSFFFPLDAVRDWNRIYGRRGLLQFQCLLPPATAREGMRTRVRT